MVWCQESHNVGIPSTFPLQFRKKTTEENDEGTDGSLLMTRILIIDDDAPTLTLLRAILEQAGYEVLEAPNGKRGIALYRAEPADLIITDIVMPEQEGLDLIMELKRDVPQVKIIAMSGGGQDRDLGYLTSAKAFGALRTIAKPFRRRDVLDAVEALRPQKAT